MIATVGNYNVRWVPPRSLHRQSWLNAIDHLHPKYDTWSKHWIYSLKENVSSSFEVHKALARLMKPEGYCAGAALEDPEVNGTVQDMGRKQSVTATTLKMRTAACIRRTEELMTMQVFGQVIKLSGHVPVCKVGQYLEGLARRGHGARTR